MSAMSPHPGHGAAPPRDIAAAEMAPPRDSAAAVTAPPPDAPRATPAPSLPDPRATPGSAHAKCGPTPGYRGDARGLPDLPPAWGRCAYHMSFSIHFLIPV